MWRVVKGGRGLYYANTPLSKVMNPGDSKLEARDGSPVADCHVPRQSGGNREASIFKSELCGDNRELRKPCHHSYFSTADEVGNPELPHLGCDLGCIGRSIKRANVVYGGLTSDKVLSEGFLTDSVRGDDS